MIWHTLIEKREIAKRFGKPLKQYGFDGLDMFGRPLEVRAIKKNNRFRIGKDVHKILLDHQGNYIFVDEYGNSKIVPAYIVEKIINKGKWFKDRRYPHKFVQRDIIFPHK